MSSGTTTVPAAAERDKAAPGGPYVSRSSIVTVLVFVLVVGVWEGACRVFDVPKIVIPAPSLIGAALWRDLQAPSFYNHMWYTLQAVIGGFVLASIIGVLLGASIAQFKLVEEIIYPYVIALQTMPKVAIAPLLVIWVGFGVESKVLVAALVALFPVLVNTVVGLKSIEQEKVDLMTALSATRWQTFKMVTLPNALPVIFAGLEIALVFSMIGAIVGEFVGAKAGLGSLINFRNMQLDLPGIFSVLVVLAVLGIVSNLLIRWVGRKLIFWQRVNEVTGT